MRILMFNKFLQSNGGSETYILRLPILKMGFAP